MKKVLFIALLFLFSCAQFRPFVDARREAGQVLPVGQSSDDRAAICYNPLWMDIQEVEKLAQESCAKTHRKPKFYDKKYFTCTLVSPVTVFYDCINPR